MDQKSMSYEYIRGLIEGEGCFTFSASKGFFMKRQKILRIPAFCISMHERDENLLKMVRDRLKLKNRVYNFRAYRNDGHNRGRMAMLTVRDCSQLKNIIVPFFHRRLIGNKGKQFIQWLERIGTDERVPKQYKIINELYKSGFYEKNRWLDGRERVP